MKPDPSWISLRDLDVSAGLPKGSAFRCFKGRLGELVEDTDFVVLDTQRDAALIADLRADTEFTKARSGPSF